MTEILFGQSYYLRFDPKLWDPGDNDASMQDPGDNTPKFRTIVSLLRP